VRVSNNSSASGSQAVGGTKASSAGAALQPTVPSVGAPADALNVSSTAQFFAVAQAHLAKIPEVRSEKVEALRAKLESDSYHPDAEAVADGIVKEHTPPHREH
jgi:flagellar biosynthesis anti-sigma factor FlgM